MSASDEPKRGAIRSVQDFYGAIFLLLIALLALYLSTQLTLGTLRAMGPGMLPLALAVLLGALGVILLIDAFKEDGPGISAPSFRAIVFVLGAFVAFGLAVRPLGLSVAGPLAVVIAGFASDETHFGETLLFGLGMTAFCIVLFKFALGLPMPLAPWSPLGY